MKQLLLGIALCYLGVFAKAQNGLENLIVEKYYKVNAADVAGSSGVLPAGSVTWRFYVDMLPGYKFQMAYGNQTHPLNINTTTTFFNNEDRGATTPAYTKTQAKSNTVMLDSWLSVGAACAGNFGVLKTEDDGVGNVVNSNGLLANTDPFMGIPLTTQDGLLAGAPQSVTFVGLSTELDVFDATSQVGNSFTTTSGAWASLNGSVGPTASNRVLIAQITTDGILHYEINIQIGTPDGGIQKYVISNPAADEISDPNLHLSGDLIPGPVAPTVSITAPANNTHSITGDVVAIAANAADADGSVVSVQFLVDGVSVGTDVTAPYTASYTGVNGTHTITAIATDNDGQHTTSAPVTLIVGADPYPVVSITSPVAGSTSVVGDVVAIAANATDNGSIASVEFFVDGVSLGIDNAAPYSASYVGVAGTHSITARATDNRGQSTTSTPVSILVKVNTPPTVSITDPINGQNKNMNTVVPISANAGDIDGTVASVEFKVNGLSLGVVTSPFQINWTPVVEGSAVLTAIATDNRGATTTSAPVTININNPNALPYQISQVVQTCLPSSVCVPVVSTKATMKDVIGYDVVLNYDKSRVMPTGNITVSNDLINASYTTYITNIDTANSLMNITIFFNGSAVDGTNFAGAGEVFCAEFNKTANFHSYDTAVFAISSLNESYATSVVTKLVKPGKFITYKDSTFHGSLAFWYDNSPIKYDIANPNDYLITNIYGCNKTTNAVQPDLMGNFVYDIWNGTSIDIERDILATTAVQSVITSFDAYLTAAVAVKNTALFTPNIYQMIAMDVNSDGQVSAGDASQINQRSVGLISEFKQSWNAGTSKPSKDWLFVNSVTLADNAYKISASYPSNDGIGYSKYKVPVVSFCQSIPVADYSSCPLISSDVFTGIMLGDINASYASITHGQGLKEAKGETNSVENEIILDLTKASLKNGVVSVPVSINSSVETHSISLALAINGSKIEDVAVTNSSKITELDGNYIDSIKTIRVGGFNVNDPIPATNSFILSLSLTSNQDASKLSSSDFNASIALLDNDQPAKLKVIDAPTGINENSIDYSVKVYPNPASDKLNVEVSENSTIQMYDVNGKLVVMETTVSANQTQVIDLANFANGVYMVKIYNENFVNMQKVVITR